MDNKAQDVRHWTLEQWIEKHYEESKRRMGLTSKIVEADRTSDHVTDNVKLIKEANTEDK